LESKIQCKNSPASCESAVAQGSQIWQILMFLDRKMTSSQNKITKMTTSFLQNKIK
jgi:hypothetical protein